MTIRRSSAKIPRALARPNQEESTAAHLVKGPAKRSRSIATADTRPAAGISDLNPRSNSLSYSAFSVTLRFAGLIKIVNKPGY